MRNAERAVTRLLNDSEELKFIRDECANLQWSNSQLAAENVQLRRAIESLIAIYYNSTITDDVIQSLRPLLVSGVDVCSCGHLMTEHDREGCCWIQCKPICGVADES